MSTSGEGPDFWTAVMAVLTGLAGGLLGLWRAAFMVGSLRTRVNDIEEDIKKIEDKVEARHEANQSWMRAVSERMATKEDIRSLESLMRSLFNSHR